MNGHTEEKNIAAEEDSPFFAGSHDYLMMLNLYDSAVKQLRLKFEVLNNEFSVTYARNPIRHIESRLKSPESIVAKLRKRGKPLTIASAMENINDIAGVRVVCRYIDDVYAVAEVQIRTVAMDFWASLEHDIRYKADKSKLPAGINEEMLERSDEIAEIDRKMQDTYKRIKAAENL